MSRSGIEHRLTKIKHRWTNAQVECTNWKIKEAIVIRYHYEGYDQIETLPVDLINATNYARRVKL